MESALPPLEPGHVIAERYRLEKRLGDGNFGEVWKATDIRMERQHIGTIHSVAVKFLKDEYVHDSEVRADFSSEVRALYQLTHHNLLRLFDFDLLPDMAYLVTEYAEGGSLAFLLGRKGSFSVQETANFLHQTAAGLDFAHAQKFVHRDLKPHNLLMAGERLVIADFGLSQISNISATRSMLQLAPSGTPAYMAPEQWEWLAGWRSDIYALGIILYQMLTGRLPFRASNNNPREWKELHQNAPIPSLQVLNPDLPAELDEIIKLALAKDPKARANSATELAERFQQIIEPKKDAKARLGRSIRPHATETTIPIGPDEKKPNQPEKAPRGWPPLPQPESGISIRTRRSAELPASSSQANNSSLIKKLGVTRQQRVPRRSNRFLPQGTLLKTLQGHTNYVSALAFSPDSSLLASASLDRTVRLWDFEQGQEIKCISEHTKSVQSVAFSPDGTLLASGSADTTIRVWDARTGQLVQVLDKHKGIVFGVAFSPDGSWLASASGDNTIKLWEVSSWKLLATLEGHSDYVNAVAFSPIEDLLASASKDGTLRLWELPSGQEIDILEGHDSSVASVVFSPDGLQLASGSLDKSVKLWKLETCEDYRTFRTIGGDWINAVAFSPDGRTLASASSVIKLRNMPGGVELKMLDDHHDLVNTVVFSPDGRFLATGADDKAIKIWSAERLDTIS